MKDWREEKEDESGDSKDGEDDELPCMSVIGGQGDGDCNWRGARS